MRSELIISTYNRPRDLSLTLLSVTRQRRRPDWVCIADDGSGEETRAVIEAFRSRFPEIALRHLWQEDHGFDKNTILNKAIASSKADYLIFIDGDCMISPGFVARHMEMARPDRFLSGTLVRLDTPATDSVTEEDVLSGRVFDIGWLRRNRALASLTTWLKAGALPKWISSLLEVVYPVRRNWGGANASVFRAAALAVNGMDEEMRYGSEDKEFGVRLENSGCKGRHLRFTAPLVHLDHPRPYKDDTLIPFNRGKVEEARRTGKTWTPNGIEKLEAPGAA